MSDNEEKITQFIDVTGCNRDRAEFFLSSANYEIEPALSSFYEAENDEIAVNIDADEVETPPQPDVTQETTIKPSEKRTKKAGNFATLQTLEDSSDEEDDKGQAFYAGGSEHGSGQQIINPNKKNPIRDMVTNIFQSAQAGNMETFDPSGGGAGGGPSSSRFAGTGYRLGETESDTVAIRSGPSAAGGAANRQSSGSECDTVTVKVWRQGFSVDDGELRPYDDPRNKEFFDCIMRNEIPPEFRKKGARTVHLNVEDHLHEEFVKKAPRFKAFTGSGHTLGSPTPSTAQEATTTLSSSVVLPSASTDNPAESESRAVSQLNVNQNEPTTMIQIRLADGSRLSAQFNVSHTVNDIRTYVSTARPQYASQNFILLTTFPNKELADGSETIEKAGLKNAAILQRLK